jgi:translocation and assembly module TamB
VHVTELIASPQEVAEFAPKREGPPLLAGTARGSALLESDGKTAKLTVQLDLPKGKLQARATSTLEKVPKWDLQLTAEKVDPGAVTGLAPHGEVNARASLHGKGRPIFDRRGVEGSLEGVVHVGPARLEQVGELSADLSASVEGRQALVKMFSGNALGVAVKAHGEARYDALKMNLTIDAPDLAVVSKAVGVLTRQKPEPIAGSLSLGAYLTGSVEQPNANVHVRAPRFRFGPALDIETLAVDGNLHGKLETPDGMLDVRAQHILAGAVDLGAPRIAMDLEWPIAHLRIDAGVEGGQLVLAGDAEIDEDKDGLTLSNFTVGYPGHTLAMVRPTSVHFRDQVIVEPLELHGEHGTLRFQAQVKPPPGRMDASLVATHFDLAFLPQFAIPKGLGLRGFVDLTAVAEGPRESPDVDVKVALSSVGARMSGGMNVDGQLHGHLHQSRLVTDGDIASGKLLRLTWQGQIPVEQFTSLPDNTPLQLDAHLSPVDLANLASVAKIDKLQEQGVRGVIAMNFSASGTLGAPRASLSIDASGLANAKVQELGLRAGFLLEKGRLLLDGQMDLSGAKAVAFAAQAPFELARALRDKAYLKGTLDRPLKADAVITSLQLPQLVKVGLLPQNSEGTLSVAARLAGTPHKPTLQVVSAGENVSLGRVHGLGFQSQLDVTDKVKLTFGAQSASDVVATLTANASLSGAELVELAQRRDDPDAIAPLLDRQISLTLDVPGLPIARASQLAGQPKVAEGRMNGRLTLSGSPARPRLEGDFAIKDVQTKSNKLGKSDLHIEADENGALVHLGLDPPGGGNLLAHAQLKADLGARTLLRDGFDSVLGGDLTGDAQAKQLDLAFLSGLAPLMRRAGGKLDLNTKVTGTLLRPVPTGELHMRGGAFDLVGQGVYEDVSANATFSPKEVVIDRITGSTGPGTFSVILSGSRKDSDDPDAPAKYEFSGEVHVGDDESVRDRKNPDGTQIEPGPLPVRQAGERRADVTAELDLFGDYSDGLLHASVKIPQARLVVEALPDKRLPDLKPHPDVELITPGQKPHPPGEKAPEEKATSNFRAHARLEIVHLYVKAEDFEFPVESDLKFDFDAQHPDSPTADGTIRVPNGSFSALGRRFTILDAKITETGGDFTDPELEIKALYENPQANVTINVSGTAKDPQLDMTSSPPMDQDAIAFFLATGRIQGRATSSGGGVDLSGAATSVLGSLLFGQVRKELANVLPVDVLTIETSGGGVSEATVGKYIGDRVYIGYRQRLAPAPNENTSEGRIEYEISRAVSIDATIGDRNSDVSVLYTKDF